MKHFLTLFLLTSILLVSCDDSKNANSDENPKEKKEELVEVKDGYFKEWYPGKKQVKFQGPQDEKGRRHGKWSFYSENGTELSFTLYEHGLREGHTVVKYPNGMIHYRGEYLHDQTVGIWTTYDEKGNVLSEKDFGYPTE